MKPDKYTDRITGRHKDGYRYCRQYETIGGTKWALWERRDGTMRRVGSAESYDIAGQFIRHEFTPSKKT